MVPGKKTPIYNEIIKSVAYPMAQVSNIIYTIYTSSRSKNTDILKNNNNKGHHMSDGPGLKYCSHNCGNQKYISNNCEMLTKIRLVFFFFFFTKSQG